MDASAPTQPSLATEDRKTGLIVFGALQLSLGSLCALLVPLMLLGMAASKTLDNKAAQPVDPHMMIPSLIFYGVIAAWFIWMGVGSILARRWARALILITSWLWLIGGVGGLAIVWLILPDMYAQMGAGGQMSKSLASIILYVTLAFMAVFYVFIPATLVCYYGSKHVKATCEARNPRPSWTDACPLPVLALSLMFGFWACSLAFAGFYGWVTPFFGFLLGGTAGAVVALATAVALALIAWGFYRLDRRAWLGAVGLVACWTLSAALTFSRFSLMDFYAKMKFPEQQLELMKKACAAHGPLFISFGVIWIAGFLGYLAYVKKCYLSSETPASINSERSP